MISAYETAQVEALTARISMLDARVEQLVQIVKERDDDRDQNPIYDLTDLESIFKVSRRTLFTWISEGILPTKVLGKKHYISKRELMALIESNPVLQKGGRHE